ncbi:MAG: hypothetical protein OXI96_05925 [Acidimicrobiaceae bacterium]|nr:hypothetical protein [Acidimicrobiaceae bacterium]
MGVVTGLMHLTCHRLRFFFHAVLGMGVVTGLMLITACRINTNIDIHVAGDGSGKVTVAVTADDDAVMAAPELISDLIVDDIIEAGWAPPIIDPIPADGGVIITTFKKFDSAHQLQPILDEIAGPEAIFSNLKLEQDSSFGETRWNFRTTINPSPQLEVFSDAELAEILDGQFFGRPAEEIEAALKASEYFFELDLKLTLQADILTPDNADDTTPEEGGVSTLTPNEVAGRTARWHFTYGDPIATISISSAANFNNPKIVRYVSIAAAIAFCVALLILVMARFMTVMSIPKGHRRRATRHRERRAATRAAESRKPLKRFLRLLIIDAHGVIVRPLTPFEGLLLPTIQKELPDIDTAFLRQRYHNLILGRITPEEFWSDIGLGPIGMKIETHYLSSYRLVPGLHEFLEKAAEQKLPVVAVSNQPRQWGERLRRMAQLEDLLDLWLTSGEVGAVLPQQSLLEAARRTMSIEVYDCLYLSSVSEHLDAAEQIGMITKHFAVGKDDTTGVSHSVVRGFADVLKTRNIG